MRIRRVAIVAHSGRDDAVTLRDELASWLKDRGIEVDDRRPDLVISLGGDGTMLRAAQSAHAADAPLLGVNLGMLGYLNEVDAPRARDSLERIFEGDYHLEERMMLACQAGEQSFVGLNEVLVERPSRQRLVRLNVRIGGEELALFPADGIIVATPTGSTAYALSAGGPIVSPNTQCLVVVPVNPHMIFSRPLVLSPDEVVEIQVDEHSSGAILTLDGGIGRDLEARATVLAQRHPRPLRLVRLTGPGFLERLRAKLHLPH